MTLCWEADPHTRPTFDALVQGLAEMNEDAASKPAVRDTSNSAAHDYRDDVAAHDYRDFTNGCTEVPQLISSTDASVQPRSHRPTRAEVQISSRRPTHVDQTTSDSDHLSDSTLGSAPPLARQDWFSLPARNVPPPPSDGDTNPQSEPILPINTAPTVDAPVGAVPEEADEPRLFFNRAAGLADTGTSRSSTLSTGWEETLI